MTRALRTSLRAALAATLIGLLLSGCGLVGGLGDDELPQELSSSHREDIEKTARAFVDGVGRYNPEIASFATLTPGELGIEEFKRFVLQVGALESAEVPVEFRALGVTSIDAERAVVHATLATTLGNLEVDMVRRGGRWRVASLPDLAIPDAGAPYRVSWAVTNSYTSSSGALVVVGTLENVGDVTLLTLGAGGYIPGADGRAVSTGTAPIIADPFLLGGETTVFRVDLTSEVTAALDPAAFVLVPNFRLAREADARSETPVSVAPKSLTPAEAAAGREVTVTNGDKRRGTATVVAVARAADGRPLSVYQSPSVDLPGRASRRVALPSPEPAALDGAAEVTLEPWGAERLG